MAKDSDILKDAKEAFAQAEESEAKNRQLWVDDMRFARLGEQWPSSIKRQRELEGRPCLTLNRLPAFIRQVTNDARQNKPSIKVHPVSDDASEETAEILDGLIRNIEYTSNADVAYDTALDHAVTGGFGYFLITTDYASDDSFDQDIVIERVVNPLTIYGDPYSKSADSSDWNTAFVTEMLSQDEFKRKYPGADTSNFEAQHDKDLLWFQDDKVRIAAYWTRAEVEKALLKMSDGSVMYADAYEKIKDILDIQQIVVTGTRQTNGYKVTQHILNGAEVLETNKWTGKYIPIVPVYGDELNIEGERHFMSLVRFAKDPQQMFNYWRTASTELVALQPKMPFIGPKGAFNTDADKWSTANTVSHAYIEYDGAVPPQRQGFTGPPAAALQEALNASDDMKSIMGLFDASLGARSNETSGRAIIARQREGDVSTFNFIDNLSRAIRHAGRIIVDLIPHVYSTERIVRVIHEDGANQLVQLNKPFPAMPPENPENADPKEIQEFVQGMTKLYDVTVGKYDITVEAGPSYTTKREESADQMMQMMQAMPQAAPFIADLVAKNLDWPGAEDIAKRLKAMLPPQIQGQNPVVAQLQQQLQMQDAQARQAIGQLQQQLAAAQTDQQKAQAELAIKAKDVELKQIELQLKQVELQIKQYEAETKRIDVESGAQIEIARMSKESMPVESPQVQQQEQQPINITIDGSRPKQKTAKAIRQPDGSYIMEAIETPL